MVCVLKVLSAPEGLKDPPHARTSAHFAEHTYILILHLGRLKKKSSRLFWDRTKRFERAMTFTLIDRLNVSSSWSNRFSERGRHLPGEHDYHAFRLFERLRIGPQKQRNIMFYNQAKDVIWKQESGNKQLHRNSKWAVIKRSLSYTIKRF